MKALYDFFINLFTITNIWWLDVILFVIVNFIAYVVAFKLVGIIFDAIGCYESKTMSIVHWIIRFAVFVGITLVFGWISQFIKWFIALQWWAITLISIGVVALIVGIIVIVYKVKN